MLNNDLWKYVSEEYKADRNILERIYHYDYCYFKYISVCFGEEIPTPKPSPTPAQKPHSSPKPLFLPSKTTLTTTSSLFSQTLFSNSAFGRGFCTESETESVESEFGMFKIVEHFHFGCMGEADYYKKIGTVLQLFPPVDNDAFMRRTISKADGKRKIYDNLFFVKVSADGTLPIYPLINKEDLWCLGLMANDTMFVFEDEKLFSETIAPLLDMKSSDVVYLKQNFDREGRYEYSYDILKSCVETLSLGYSASNSYCFMDCLSNVYGCVIKAVVSPKMKQFIGENVIGGPRADRLPLPADVKSVFSDWGRISKFYLSGGFGDCLVDGVDCDLERVKLLIAIVTGSDGSPPQKKLASWSPKDVIQNHKDMLEKARLKELKAKALQKKWEDASKKEAAEEKAVKRVKHFFEKEVAKQQNFVEKQQKRQQKFFYEEELRREKEAKKIGKKGGKNFGKRGD